MAGVSKWISPEAQRAAKMIDRLCEELLSECGLPRLNRTGATERSLAAIIQWAIDERIEQMEKGADA
jgi:hypothetical protein